MIFFVFSPASLYKPAQYGYKKLGNRLAIITNPTALLQAGFSLLFKITSHEAATAGSKPETNTGDEP